MGAKESELTPLAALRKFHIAWHGYPSKVPKKLHISCNFATANGEFAINLQSVFGVKHYTLLRTDHGNMNWTLKTTNTAIISALSDYRDFVMRIATLYAGTRLVELIDLSALGSETKIAISNDFSEGMTTIRTVDQLSQSIRCGEYGQLALGLGVIQLCTAFEIFFDSVASAQGVTVSLADSFDATHSSIGGTVKLGNKTLMQIRKLHLSLGISSPMNSDEVLIKLASIIEARNCFTHAGGLVTTTKAKERLWAYRIPSTVGQPLKLNDNHLDDFLHYMTINTLAFVNNVP